MMDLLVQVAVKYKLSPTAVSIVAYNEESGHQVDYKASQAVGSLGVATIQLVTKNRENDKHKLIEQKRKSQLPFEVSYDWNLHLFSWPLFK